MQETIVDPRLTTAEEHAEGEEHECCKHEAKAADVPGIIYYVEASEYEVM